MWLSVPEQTWWLWGRYAKQRALQRAEALKGNVRVVKQQPTPVLALLLQTLFSTQVSPPVPLYPPPTPPYPPPPQPSPLPSLALPWNPPSPLGLHPGVCGAAGCACAGAIPADPDEYTGPIPLGPMSLTDPPLPPPPPPPPPREVCHSCRCCTTCAGINRWQAESTQ